VDALLLRPIPFKDAHELARLSMRDAQGGTTSVERTVFTSWRQGGRFAAVEAAVTGSSLFTTEAGEATRPTANVSAGIFNLVGGARPILGTLFDAANDSAAREGDVVISETLWKGLYHSDPGLVGRPITIDGE